MQGFSREARSSPFGSLAGVLSPVLHSLIVHVSKAGYAFGIRIRALRQAASAVREPFVLFTWAFLRKQLVLKMPADRFLNEQRAQRVLACNVHS